MKQYILFDLDGTLTDPKVGITTCVQYALAAQGIEEPDLDKLEPFIGPPLKDSFMEFYGFSKEKAERAVEFYREYYKRKGIFENKVYEGIPCLLKALYEKEKKIILATSKPERFAKQILEHFNLDKYFSLIAGATMDETRSKKEDVLSYAIEKSGISDLSDAIMIGDRKFDIEGAHKFGIKAVGVLFGYGTRDELEAAGADFIAETTDELNKILLNC